MNADQEIGKTLNHKGHEETQRKIGRSGDRRDRVSGKANTYHGSTRIRTDYLQSSALI
jgi:hypothetical protein